MNTTGKFLFGFVVGAIAGATIGLLLAPEKGENTRKLISETIEEYAQKGKDFYDSKKSKTKEDEDA